MRTRLGAAMLLAAAFGGCAETIGDPYVAPGKFRFLRCPDIAARQDTAEARHTELLALMKRSGAGVGGGAVNTFRLRARSQQCRGGAAGVAANCGREELPRQYHESSWQARARDGPDPLTGLFL